MLPQRCCAREAECRSEYRTSDTPALRCTFPSAAPVSAVLASAAIIIAGGLRNIRGCTARERNPMAQTAAQPAPQTVPQTALGAQTIEAFVGQQLDNARMGPVHWRVLALVAAGYFFDVLDFTIFGALVPDLLKSGFVTQQQVPWIGGIRRLC